MNISTSGSQSAFDLFELSEPESPPPRPKLKRGNTLSSLRPSHHKTVTDEEKIEILYNLSKNNLDIDIDSKGVPISPRHHRRKKTKKKSLDKTIDELEKISHVRSREIEDKINMTVDQLKEYECVDEEMRNRLDDIFIFSPLDKVIGEVLVSNNVELLFDFKHGDWNQELMNKLILDQDGNPHVYSYQFSCVLFERWILEETYDTCFRSNGPLIFLLVAWMESSEEIEYKLVEGSISKQSLRLTRRILLHIQKLTGDVLIVLALINKLIHHIGASTETLVCILFLRYYVPSFYERGLDTQVMKTMIDYISHKPRCMNSQKVVDAYENCIQFLHYNAFGE